MDNKPMIKVKLNKPQPEESQDIRIESNVNDTQIATDVFENESISDEWSILDMDLFVKDCLKNGINIYGTFSQLSYNTDIILAMEDAYAFLDFCLDNDIKTAFYYMDFPSIIAATIDFETIREHLTRDFERRISMFKYKYPNIPTNYFDSALDSVLERASEEIVAQNSISENLNEEEPYIIELFCIIGSTKVGIILGEEEHTLDEIKSAQELFNEYSSEVNNNIQLLEEAAVEENEEIENRKAEDYRNALNEIETFLMTDPKLMTMKFKNARQDYADKLRVEWGERINQTITQKDVKAIIEKVYIERKEI